MITQRMREGSLPSVSASSAHCFPPNSECSLPSHRCLRAQGSLSSHSLLTASEHSLLASTHCVQSAPAAPPPCPAPPPPSPAVLAPESLSESEF
eukprot:3401048-Rhodomonas_salina.1